MYFTNCCGIPSLCAFLSFFCFCLGSQIADSVATTNMSASKVAGVLSAFNSLHRPVAFVTVSSDNRLKLWDIVSGKLRQQYTEPNHLAAEYTAVAFGGGSEHNAGLGVVALGTKQGGIVVWDLTSDAIVHRLGGGAGKGHALAITALAFNSDCTVLYSASEDKNVSEWNIKSGQLIR
jgi:WD40 repeat protein